ncbi:MAG: leucine-rich repeat domain-containing protein [Runella sp.]
MKSIIVYLLLLSGSVLYAQVKVMTLAEAESQWGSIKSLNEQYPSDKKFFEGSREAYFNDQQKFLFRTNSMTRQLRSPKDNGLLMCRFFVSEQGRFDYLIYETEGSLTENSKNQLLDSLRLYLENYRYSVKITKAHSFYQVLQMGIVRQVQKKSNMISTLAQAEATTRPDTVKVLSLNQLDLKEVPDVIYKFSELKELNLSYNQLKAAHIDLSRLPKLRHLWLNGNQLTDSTFTLPENNTLKILNLQSNLFRDVPQAARQCRKLESLWLGYNQFTNLNDDSFKGLKYLKDLNLYSCELKSLPDGIAKLRRLEVLDLYYNQLPKLPTSLKRMKRLQQLALSHNQFNSFPTQITKLKRLENLYIHHNKLTSLPKNIRKLRELKILDVNHNYISELPTQLGKLRSVEEIDISYNNLSEVPKETAQIRSLKKLYLRHNPFSDDEVLLSRSRPALQSLESNKTEVFY